MRLFLVINFSIIISLSSCGQSQKKREGYPGNNIIEFVQDKKDKQVFTDPIDDTISYKKVIDDIYLGKDNKPYVLGVSFRPTYKDTFLYIEYFKDISYFFDLKSYRPLKKGYFTTKGKVYLWWGNSDGTYPIEVVGADPKTFIPFESVAGGTDKNFVFYGGPPGDFEKIQNANPKSIRVLNPERGCWNCGDCYFADDNHVYYGLIKIDGADPKTFELVNQDTMDAKDKFRQYFEGKPIQ